MTFVNPLGVTDYEAIMGVQPGSINPHMGSEYYNSGNRFSVMSRNSRTKMTTITDGTSSTIMVTECGGRPMVFRNRSQQSALSNDQGIGWADSEGPFSLDGASTDGAREGCGLASGCTMSMNVRNDNEPYSFHTGGGNFLFADGHVQFVRESISIHTFAALCTRSAGEVIAGDAF